MSQQFPTLEKMGVTNTEDIHSYTLRMEGMSDVLKIYFKTSNVWLPRSKKYHFSRVSKKVLVDSNRQLYQDVEDMSPQLEAAIAELDSIVDRKMHHHNDREQLLKDIDHLEKVMRNKIGEIRALIEKMR